MPRGLNFTRSGEGSPLVLVHGLGSELCVWEPVLGALAAEHDVIAVDLPGFGTSPALEDDPTPEALAASLAALLDELGIERAHVAGNSLGGWVAIELAKAGRALSVTGICPAGLWPAPVVRPEGAPAPGRAQRLAHRLRWIIPALLAPPPVRRVVLAPFVAHPERVPWHAAWRMVRSYGRATAYAATSTAMRSSRLTGADDLDVPVTLAFGERDRLIRPARLPGATTVTLPDCGHIPMWDDPVRVARTVLETTARAREPEPAAPVA